MHFQAVAASKLQEVNHHRPAAANHGRLLHMCSFAHHMTDMTGHARDYSR